MEHSLALFLKLHKCSAIFPGNRKERDLYQETEINPIVILKEPSYDKLCCFIVQIKPRNVLEEVNVRFYSSTVFNQESDL